MYDSLGIRVATRVTQKMNLIDKEFVDNLESNVLLNESSDEDIRMGALQFEQHKNPFFRYIQQKNVSEFLNGKCDKELFEEARKHHEDNGLRISEIVGNASHMIVMQNNMLDDILTVPA